MSVLAGCASSGAGRAAAPAPAEPSGPPLVLDRPPALVVEAIVTDKKGAPVDTLHVRDFEVSVDGRRRSGVAMARLYRGPGASVLAASAAGAAPGEAQPVAEPTRTIVLVVDQPSLGPGDEKRAHALVEACLGALGVADSVAVVSLPMRPGPALEFDRAAIRGALAALRPLRAAGAEAWNIDAAETTRPGDDTRRPGAGAVNPTISAETTAEERPGTPPANPPGDAPPAPAGGANEVSPAVLKAHAVSSLAGLRQVLRALGQVPGGKTILFVSAGLVATDAQPEARAVAEEAARAQARIFVLQVPTVSSFGDPGARDLQRLAQDTGGRLVPTSSKPEQAVERTIGQLAFSYLLLLAPVAGDTDPAPHALQVTLPARRDLTIAIARAVAPGRITREALAASLSPRAAAEAARTEERPPVVPRPAAPPGAKPGPVPFPHDRSLDLLLGRVSEYVWDYGRELSSIVSEETYRQEVRGGPTGNILLNGTDAGAKADTSRTLVSDYLLVKVPGLDGWLPFRDVYEVDGKPVRDRQDRLVKLFLQSSAAKAADSGNAIVHESARYNIGNLRRDVNLPTLPLWFLEPRNLHRLNFRKSGEETLAGRRVWVLEYTEVVRPTFIKNSAGADMPSSGRIWVEPATGRVDRTLLSASVATITVDYAPREEVPGLWLPVTMEEKYVAGSMTITGKATYARFRQFQVKTTELIDLPKK